MADGDGRDGGARRLIPMQVCRRRRRRRWGGGRRLISCNTRSFLSCLPSAAGRGGVFHGRTPTRAVAARLLPRSRRRGEEGVRGYGRRRPGRGAVTSESASAARPGPGRDAHAASRSGPVRRASGPALCTGEAGREAATGRGSTAPQAARATSASPRPRHTRSSGPGLANRHGA